MYLLLYAVQGIQGMNLESIFWYSVDLESVYMEARVWKLFRQR